MQILSGAVKFPFTLVEGIPALNRLLGEAPSMYLVVSSNSPPISHSRAGFPLPPGIWQALSSRAACPWTS
jgi:hypothetical protein